MGRRAVWPVVGIVRPVVGIVGIVVGARQAIMRVLGIIVQVRLGVKRCGLQVDLARFNRSERPALALVIGRITTLMRSEVLDAVDHVTNSRLTPLIFPVLGVSVHCLSAGDAFTEENAGLSPQNLPHSAVFVVVARLNTLLFIMCFIILVIINNFVDAAVAVIDEPIVFLNNGTRHDEIVIEVRVVEDLIAL